MPRSPHIDPRSDHLSFQADSLEEVQATLQACGMPFVRQEVFEDGVHVSQLFVRDPDGYTIEVCCVERAQGWQQGLAEMPPQA